VVLTTSAGVHGQPLAEFVLTAMLHFSKDVPKLLQWQARHHWERYCGRELAGSRALVIGLGGVGRRIAELCAALDVVVAGMRRRAQGALPAGVLKLIALEQLDEALSQTDYLVIATPHTPETHHLIDDRRLSLLPQSSVLINVGRGRVIDEPALIAALQDGRLHGAALDVFEEEPLPPESPLWDMPNVLISPHSSSVVPRENERIVDVFVENLRRYLDGRPLLNRFEYDREY
jgi:phosphoglycerate dehydrogenase-like enzyme